MKRSFLPIPLSTWIWQGVYVVLSLGLLFASIEVLTRDNTSATYRSAFAVIFIVVMIVGNIVWRLCIARKKYVLTTVFFVLTLLVNAAVSLCFILNAHG